MKRNIISALVLLAVMLVAACNSTQSLQEYYIDNSENPNFISLDVPTSILNLEESDLDETQKEAYQSLRKLNLLAFKKTSTNEAEYTAEKAKVSAILKDKNYKELMKLNSEFGKGVIKYLGEDDAIDEVVIYGSSDDKGFALIRVLGNDMNPAHLMQLMQAIQSADYDEDALGDIGKFLKG
ncbi:DUF4252 domain-containing protein [Lentiprolixibacter aurantiacus]|uniref:DUF4252 domain-containing protein n=1 Tax=Lentiprolixibacter aurantiacus TaxID=2993939 RepID=A0AAE3SQ70_9FLAO|nr:DUF4252 domain-containing protein [Lentiprolixibacter aurantiacus]MCX2720212.1 DUF4252 domain-containing protein [Lentiprolixibacter aurantiacus]